MFAKISFKTSFFQRSSASRSFCQIKSNAFRFILKCWRKTVGNQFQSVTFLSNPLSCRDISGLFRWVDFCCRWLDLKFFTPLKVPTKPIQQIKVESNKKSTRPFSEWPEFFLFLKLKHFFRKSYFELDSIDLFHKMNQFSETSSVTKTSSSRA